MPPTTAATINLGMEDKKSKRKRKGKANCQPSSSLERRRRRRRRSPNEIKRDYFLLHKCKKKNSCKAFSTTSNTSLQNVISLPPPQYHCWSPSADNPLPKMLTNLLAKFAKQTISPNFLCKQTTTI
jgi:hypothetical protein